jgi:hypothetical protein
MRSGCWTGEGWIGVNEVEWERKQRDGAGCSSSCSSSCRQGRREAESCLLLCRLPVESLVGNGITVEVQSALMSVKYV